MRQPKSISYLDRVTALIATIAEHERFNTVDGLIALIIRMTAHFGTEARIRFSERLRDAADAIEHCDDELRWQTEQTR
jgi:hypothetical protein